MRRFNTLFRVGLLLAAALWSIPAYGQVAPGSIVRFVRRDSSRVRARLLSLDSVSVSVIVPGAYDLVRYPRADISHLQLLQGTHMAGLRPVGVGAMIGAGVGLGFSLLVVRSDHSTPQQRDGTSVAAVIPIVTLFGGVIGAVIGSPGAFRVIEDWVTLTPASATTPR